MAVWFITGTSRGLGHFLVKNLLDQGHQVVSLSRHSDIGIQHAQLLNVQVDLLNAESVQNAVQQTVARFGHIDYVVNNAGRGLLGAIEEASPEEISQVFDLNVNAVINVIQQVLPVLREQKSGVVINVSSLAGITGAQSWGVYSASKFAVEGLSEALAKEVGAFGIKVLIVEPGILRTEFLNDASLLVSKKQLDAYAETVGVARQQLSTNRNQQPGNPDLAAQYIIQHVENNLSTAGIAERLIVGADAKKFIHNKFLILEKQIQQNLKADFAIEYEEALT
ncbi:hypothetical protein B9T31_08980 [Acinetobacter sp. ANC 4558]|uniref:SDR family oxidoreductase n=1 Tax=Acinetobacter sp. ANC 4558 TaxID=1977876 RepID=UPI000A339698|nr:SDR family oxidoreductase [Acinetobacter sp. ANC 4558]OTG86162.1 hypothetical protein B9T31_08980 [Acinetobacter sp. ANC 4558]